MSFCCCWGLCPPAGYTACANAGPVTTAASTTAAPPIVNRVSIDRIAALLRPQPGRTWVQRFNASARSPPPSAGTRRQRISRPLDVIPGPSSEWLAPLRRTRTSRQESIARSPPSALRPRSPRGPPRQDCCGTFVSRTRPVDEWSRPCSRRRRGHCTPHGEAAHRTRLEVALRDRGCLSVGLHPGLRLVEHGDRAADLELATLGPHLRLVDLSVLGIGDRPPLVPVATDSQVLNDHEAHDGFILVRPRALGTDLRFPLRIVGFGQPDDLAEDLAVLLVDLHVRHDLARLLVDRVPRADRRVEARGRRRQH